MIKKSAREHILSKLRKNTGFSNEDFSNSPDIKHRGLAWTDPGAECEALKTTLNNLAVVFQTPEDKLGQARTPSLVRPYRARGWFNNVLRSDNGKEKRTGSLKN